METSHSCAVRGIIRHQPGELVFTANVPDLTANLTAKAEAYLRSLKLDPEDLDQASLLFFHVIASVHSSAYRTENADALRLDWPRIPVPARKQTLVHSAELGQRIAALLDTEAAVKGVTSNPIRPELKLLGPVSRVGSGSLSADELALTAGWGTLVKVGSPCPERAELSSAIIPETKSNPFAKVTSPLECLTTMLSLYWQDHLRRLPE